MSTSNSKTPRFQHVLHVRLSSHTYEHVKAQAACVGVSRSRFAREVLEGVKIRTAADAAVLRELRRLGGLCKHAILEGADSEECKNTIKSLSNYASALIKNLEEQPCKIL